MDEWPVLDSTVDYRNPLFSAGRDRVRRLDGETADYYWVDPADGASVVALTEDDEVVLVEEYRPRQRQPFLTCPRGAVGADEPPAEAARRELREETGYEAREVELLLSYHPSGWIRHQRHVCLATGLTAGEQALDDGEYVTVRTLPVEETVDAVLESGAGWGVGPLLVAREYGHR
jgi:ADP-ribose pyrophosphatase